MNSQIYQIIERIESRTRNLPETFIYNEGWMIRIVLNWFQQNPTCIHDLSFCNKNSEWFSEALLPSPFLPKKRGDNFSESWTHADGAVGNFLIGKNQFGDLTLKEDCDYFYIVEAKIYSELSKGTKNAIYYNQAARYVACIIELLKRQNLNFKEFKKLGFYVIAPIEQIVSKRNMIEFTNKNHIKNTILRRINEYPDSDINENFIWIEQNLAEIIDFMDIKLLDWEHIIEFIADKEISNFYSKCLFYNKKRKK